MNVHEIRRYQMLTRVRRFGAMHQEMFVTVPLAMQTFAELGQAIDVVEQQASRQASDRHRAREHTRTKAEARKMLCDSLRTIARTARAIALDRPGVDAGFRPLREPSDLLLIAFARNVADRAALLEEEFLAHAMPDTFVADLRAATDVFEAATRTRHTATGAHVAARVGIEESVARGFLAVRRLDVIVVNCLRGNHAALAAWRCARRVERSPAKDLRIVTPLAIPEREAVATSQQSWSVPDEAREQPHEIPRGMRPHLAA